ncbi:TPA: CBS domain-containing protein [Candidatus Bathyarchaeota archaeon]|nr:CBS domain-containing protein [Candidatus Bathyarchaeota archaeon]
MKFVADAPYRRDALGYYREILLAQSTDPELRKLSHSGGVVTAILTQALQDGMIDSAIVSEAEPYEPLKLKPQISLVPDDVLSAVDSKFSASSVAKAFGNAVREYGKTKIAFVGVPHQILAIRKLEAWEHKIMQSLELTIGLFCLWVFSLNKLLDYLKESFKIEHSEIKRIDLTDKYIVHSQNRSVKIPLEEVMPHILNKCRTCTDFTAELADISVGGAYPLGEWSIVIVRTKKGQEALNRALETGAIRARKIEKESEVFAHLLSLAVRKKKIAIEEIRKLEQRGLSIPPINHTLTFLQSEKFLMANKKIEDVMSRDLITVTPETSIAQLLDVMAMRHHMGYPVVDEKEELIGIVTFEDIMNVSREERDKVSVREIAKKRLVTAYPDDSVLDAFEKMNAHDIGRILIVDRQNPKRILGIITRSDIMHALRRI